MNIRIVHGHTLFPLDHSVAQQQHKHPLLTWNYQVLPVFFCIFTSNTCMNPKTAPWMSFWIYDFNQTSSILCVLILIKVSLNTLFCSEHCVRQANLVLLSSEMKPWWLCWSFFGVFLSYRKCVPNINRIAISGGRKLVLQTQTLEFINTIQSKYYYYEIGTP
jgi:hypothetical protein